MSHFKPKQLPGLDIYGLELKLGPDELEFFRTQTKINDEEKLKEHIIAVQNKAFEIYAFPCLAGFLFTELRISRLPGYQQVLEIARTQKDAFLLDIGCCFGQAARKAVADGFPAENVIGSDLYQGFWDLGHELFCSTSESFPAGFVAGDVFDDGVLARWDPIYDWPVELANVDLKNVKSLNELGGRLSVIHAASLFHLFNEEKQEDLAFRLAGLMSSRPGSIVLGSQYALATRGAVQGKTGFTIYCHSPESWAELWNGKVFRKGSVKVHAELKEMPSGHVADKILAESEKAYVMRWSVIRLE